NLRAIHVHPMNRARRRLTTRHDRKARVGPRAQIGIGLLSGAIAAYPRSVGRCRAVQATPKVRSGLRYRSMADEGARWSRRRGDRLGCDTGAHFAPQGDERGQSAFLQSFDLSRLVSTLKAERLLRIIIRLYI